MEAVALPAGEELKEWWEHEVYCTPQDYHNSLRTSQAGCQHGRFLQCYQRPVRNSRRVLHQSNL